MSRQNPALVALGAALVLTGCAGQAAIPQTAPSAPPPAASSPTAGPSSPATGKGAYHTYEECQTDPALLADNITVLFFYASWCPDCLATDASLKADGVPAGLTVVKVSYDDRVELKKQYGVTQQHTFVQVDKMGEKVAMWTGTTTGEAILAKIKRM